MKRILFVHHVSSIGGGSYCLLNLVKSIDKKEFEPVVLLFEDGPLKIELEKSGVQVIFFSKMTTVPYNQDLFRLPSILSYTKVARSLTSFKTILVENNIDIVYLNNMMLYPYLKAAKETGVKSIIHIREHWPLDEHKHQLGWARRYVYQYADRIIAINKYSASMFPNKKSTIIYDWIDMDSRDDGRLMSDILGENTENLKIYLYTGGLQKIKGALEVVDAFANHVQSSNARLLTVGLHKPVSGSYMRRIAKKALNLLGIKTYSQRLFDLIESDKRIICMDQTYMISSIIKQSYCNLSFFTIPHANLALAECEILCVPSVVASTDESLEYSLDGELAILYEINNYKEFCKAVNAMDERYHELKKSLHAKSNIIKQKFSPEENISKLYDTLISIIS